MTETADPLKTEIKQAIVRSLRLPMTAEEIGDSTPLFADGLGLDSIDVLELVLEIERSFGVAITDEETGVRVLRSVDTHCRVHPRSRTPQEPMTPGGSPGGPGPARRRQRLHRRPRGMVPRLRRRRRAGVRAVGRAAGARRADDASRCSICSIAPECARHFSSSAGSLSDTPGWFRRYGTPVTKSARTVIGTSASTSSTVRRSDAISGPASAR